MLQKPKQRLAKGNACTSYKSTGYDTNAITIQMSGNQDASSQDGAAAVIDCAATQVCPVSAQLLRHVCWQLPC